MSTTQLLLTLLCLLGALQGLLLGFAVATVEAVPRRANRLLSLILLGSAAVLAVILLSHRTAAAATLELVEYSMWLFAGPLVYRYVSLVATADRASLRSWLPHLVPGVAWLVYLGVRYAGGRIDPTLWLPPVGGLILHQMLYTALAFRRWRRAPASARAGGVHATWVPTLLIVLLLQHAAQVIRWRWHAVEALRDVVPLVGAASFVVVTFVGLRRALPLLAGKRRRYAGSTLGERRAREIADRLAAMLQGERPFLRPELTLDELAAALAVPKTHLSQVINQRLGKSFGDLLGGYRLRESERLLCDEGVAHLTIEAIARRSGFNSRSAFYTAFRRKHGVTPSEYRRRSAGRSVVEPAPAES